MREETFTPGPWPEPVRTAAGNWLLGRSPAIAGAPKEADARLIASAPELLNTCDELLDFIGIMFGAGPDATIPESINTPLGIPVKVGRIIRDAKAVAAKAKGLEPRLVGEE